MTGTLSELTCLTLQRPAADASPARVAGFYLALADAHDHLADEAHTDLERCRERALSGSARRRAHALLTTSMTTEGTWLS